LTVSFVEHASILIEINRTELLLCDPWYEGGIFNDSWTLLKKPELDKIDFSRLKHIWISHEHPDHLNFPTLKKIRELTNSNLTIYFRKQENPNVRDSLRELGFNVVELEPHIEREIAPGIFINSFPSGIDCALVIRSKDCVILNQNDCQLIRSETRKIRKQYPRIDLWFFQFSLAGYYANHDDTEGLKQAKEKHLNLIRRYYEAFKPTIFVPFASFVAFSKEGNAYLNNWRVSLDEITTRLNDLPVQIVWSGDKILWNGWEERNKKNLKLWRDLFASPIEIKPHPFVDESELIDAGKKMVRQRPDSWVRLLPPPETHLKILETGKAAVIDFRKGEFRIESEPDKSKLAGILPSEELWFFLKYPYGADTLNITSCFYVVDQFKWKRLLYYRDSLYRKKTFSELIEKIFNRI